MPTCQPPTEPMSPICAAVFWDKAPAAGQVQKPDPPAEALTWAVCIPRRLAVVASYWTFARRRTVLAWPVRSRQLSTAASTWATALAITQGWRAWRVHRRLQAVDAIPHVQRRLECAGRPPPTGNRQRSPPVARPIPLLPVRACAATLALRCIPARILSAACIPTVEDRTTPSALHRPFELAGKRGFQNLIDSASSALLLTMHLAVATDHVVRFLGARRLRLAPPIDRIRLQKSSYRIARTACGEIPTLAKLAMIATRSIGSSRIAAALLASARTPLFSAAKGSTASATGVRQGDLVEPRFHQALGIGARQSSTDQAMPDRLIDLAGAILMRGQAHRCPPIPVSPHAASMSQTSPKSSANARSTPRPTRAAGPASAGVRPGPGPSPDDAGGEADLALVFAAHFEGGQNRRQLPVSAVVGRGFVEQHRMFSWCRRPAQARQVGNDSVVTTPRYSGRVLRGRPPLDDCGCAQAGSSQSRTSASPVLVVSVTVFAFAPQGTQKASVVARPRGRRAVYSGPHRGPPFWCC